MRFAVKDQSLIDEMREAMKDARERAEERRESSHETVLVTSGPEPSAAAEPAPPSEAAGQRRSVLRRLLGRR
jgi:hypothetical protein